MSVEASNKDAPRQVSGDSAGVQERGTREERRQELGRPSVLPRAKELRAGRESQLDGGRTMGPGESDHLIVL